MDGPPSFTSIIARNSDPQLTEPNYLFEQDDNIPSMSKMRSYSSFEDRTASRALVVQVPVQPTGGTYDIDDVVQVQPLSAGAMAVRGSDSEVQIPDQLITGASYNNNNNEQAPSMGVMVGERGDYSQPAAGGYFSYNAPPSHADVAPRDESYTGGSGGGGENIPEGGNYERMSLTGRDFARLYPTMYP